MTRDEFLRKRGMLVKTGLTEDELAERMFRSDHRCICPECGKRYGSHPLAEEVRDIDGNPFLHVICDGSIVKL